MIRRIIINGNIILPDKIIEDGYLTIEKSLISEVGRMPVQLYDHDEIIDAKGAFVSPGFIDIHTHGGGGFNFLDGTVEAFLAIAETHAEYGTTALLPTTSTSTDEALYQIFDVYKQAKRGNIKGAAFLGIHLEGPYFSYNQRGAQDPKYLKIPKPDDYLNILDASDDIVRWSIAPELEGALELGSLLRSKGIIPSVAHTDAICEEVMAAFDQGYRLMTHLYSGMSTVTRKNAFRYAGALEAAFLIDDMDVEIIADGVHLPKSLLQFVYKFKGPDKTALVTDSIRAAGIPMAAGFYCSGSLDEERKILIEDGVAKLPDRSAFAGSIATTNRLVRTMVQVAEISLTDAVKMMSLTPARILGLDSERGSLAKGKNADVVIFDKNIDVKTTIINGCTVFEKRT
jgi:N-acetylglucosamine-6-phosphate deacetylase